METTKELRTSGKYFTIHAKLAKNHGKADHCENPNCEGKSVKFNWCLKKGRQYSDDVNDYIQLCVSCHKHYDFTEEIRIKLSNAKKGKTPNHNIDKFIYSGIEAAKKPISQHSKTGEFIKRFSSITEANKELNILVSSISNCLKGLSKSAGGYKWLIN